jgi:hypothetical protein
VLLAVFVLVIESKSAMYETRMAEKNTATANPVWLSENQIATNRECAVAVKLSWLEKGRI